MGLPNHKQQGVHGLQPDNHRQKQAKAGKSKVIPAIIIQPLPS